MCEHARASPLIYCFNSSMKLEWGNLKNIGSYFVNVAQAHILK